LLQPSHIGLVALRKFRIALRRAPKVVVTSWDVQRDERHAALIPSNILAVFSEAWVLALATQRHCSLIDLTKRQLVAQILRQYERRGDAMRYLDNQGKKRVRDF
jgi:hypothetical protein